MTPDWDEMLVVGRIARTHGLRGEVVVNLETDFPETRFRAGAVMFVAGESGPQAMTIETVRFHRGRPVVRFAGVEDIEGAEALGRGDLRVAAESVAPLPEGTYYHHELVGCLVVADGGEPLGRVVRVEAAGGPLLVVEARGREVLVPLAAEFCVSIDPCARRIEVRLPEGLFELND